MFIAESRPPDMDHMKIAIAALATLALSVAVSGPANASSTRSCGNAAVSLGKDSEGGAWRIRGTQISCDRARAIAATCVRGTHRGWSRSSTSSEANGIAHVRTALQRDKARVTFEIVGGGGC